MSIDGTILFKELHARLAKIPAAPRNLNGAFEQLRELVQEHGKYIVLVFPEYTPHDVSKHLDHLFSLADRLLGPDLYRRLNPTELTILAFSLYAHDWGMAVGRPEREALAIGRKAKDLDLVPGEPADAQAYLARKKEAGVQEETAWREYLRTTHGLRSGARLRAHLSPFGSVFADAVARAAEGHTFDIREIRDPSRFPHTISVFGETVNLAAISTYVRLVDLLDIGEDRTPFALWKFVAPADPVSKGEWDKHRALSPVAIRSGESLREVVVSGHTDDPRVYASLSDLEVWAENEFASSLSIVRAIGAPYDLDLDSRIRWSVTAAGFEPIVVRFEVDRSKILAILGNELYNNDPLAFLRELLQNSVDAIDARQTLLAENGASIKGEITVTVTKGDNHHTLAWRDNGIGMNLPTIRDYLARVGASWYQSSEFNKYRSSNPISKFGVGMLSCFSVAKRLTIETRIDPNLRESESGLRIEIPEQDKHFGIRKVSGLSVGTTVTLAIEPGFSARLTQDAVADALADIARFVDHSVSVSDGTSSQQVSGARAPEVFLGSIEQDESLNPTLGLVSLASFRLTDPKRLGYEGTYSAVVPAKPLATRSQDDRSVWELEGQSVELDHFIFHSEQQLFVKGIRAGPVSRDHRRRYSLHGMMSPSASSWVRPTVLLNIHNPSSCAFNLARDSVQIVRKEIVLHAWMEIVDHLRATVFSWNLDEAEAKAKFLGCCALYAGVPQEALEQVFPNEETPVLIIRPHDGLLWCHVKDFSRAAELPEAPFEFAYVANGSGSRLLENPKNFSRWSDGDVLFPPGLISAHAHPWIIPAETVGLAALNRALWSPVSIRVLKPGADDYPRVCRIWRKLEAKVVPTWALYREQPELVHFPETHSNYAALGSRYWNIDHPKIKAIVACMSALYEKSRTGQIRGPCKSRLEHACGSSYLGYVVPNCRSGKRLAIEVPNRLVDIAKDVGMPCSTRLEEADFMPGTVGVYENPYHVDPRRLFSAKETAGTRR